jgi:hypothetical protein
LDILLALFLLPILASTVVITVRFIGFLFTGKQFENPGFRFLMELISVLIAPIVYVLTLDAFNHNNCCGDSATFSPPHRLTIYLLIILCMAAYFYAARRKKIAPPLVELVVNCLLLIGIALNLLISIQIYTEFSFLPFIGTIPIAMLMIMMLANNHQQVLQHLQEQAITPKNGVEKLAWRLLSLNVFVKMPVLLVLCLPVLAILAVLLLLTGQQPDSMVKAFTETYKHGFSQLDHLCDNVQCGGHFLCSVAAKGHKEIVKPTRLGIRNNNLILCNRQLLVSNAFEDLLQQKLPGLHKRIRSNYNRVGNVIHRYYFVFNKKWVCDVVYVLMKPAEWLFLLVLYTFDTKPENRIAQQYISQAHRQQLL